MVEFANETRLTNNLKLLKRDKSLQLIDDCTAIHITLVLFLSVDTMRFAKPVVICDKTIPTKEFLSTNSVGSFPAFYSIVGNFWSIIEPMLLDNKNLTCKKFCLSATFHFNKKQ